MDMENSLSISDVEHGSEKPPDKGKASQKISFRDKLMGCGQAPKAKKCEDLFEQGNMKVEFMNENPLLPKILVDKSVMKELCALVVCVLGKKLGFRTMRTKLSHVWKLSSDFDLLDVGNGFCMVKFDIEEDKNKVIGGGPWMIFDRYLAVSTWSPEFMAQLVCPYMSDFDSLRNLLS